LPGKSAYSLGHVRYRFRTRPSDVTQAKAPRAPRQAHQVLERLFQLYPKMFGARFLPLKLGVFRN
jgi:hypothetical protein